MGDKTPNKAKKNKKAPKGQPEGKNAPVPAKPIAPPTTGPKKKGNK